MTSITPTSGANPAAAAQPGLLGGADFNMFLRLLTTQMQNQDPLDPMDTSEYTQQLVQYSQVEQSIQQTGVLKDILARLSMQDMAEAAGLIGREVEIDTAVSGLSATAPAQWSWSVPRAAATVTGTITDASGKTVATPVLTPGSDGRFSWDGRLATGGTAPAGRYTLKLEAKDTAGATLPVTLRSVGRVDDVLASGGALGLGINGITLPAAGIVRVAAPPAG